MEEVGLPVLAVEGLGDDVAGKAEVGLAVLAAVDVAVQVRQEQPPHRRLSRSLAPPTPPQSDPSRLLDDSSRGRVRSRLRRPGIPSPGALESEIGSGARICGGVCSRQLQPSGETEGGTEWDGVGGGPAWWGVGMG